MVRLQKKIYIEFIFEIKNVYVKENLNIILLRNSLFRWKFYVNNMLHLLDNKVGNHLN